MTKVQFVKEKKLFRARITLSDMKKIRGALNVAFYALRENALADSTSWKLGEKSEYLRQRDEWKELLKRFGAGDV